MDLTTTHYSTCKRCDRDIESDRGGPGALWYGQGFLDRATWDWCCDQNRNKNFNNGYGKHEPEVYPSEVDEAIASILKEST